MPTWRERSQRRRDPVPERAPAEQPPAALEQLLGLQRAAGNRAVARLLHDKATNHVHVPQDYAEQRIPWDEKNKVSVEREPEPKDPTLAALLAKHPALIKGHMQTGFQLGKVDDMKPQPADKLRDMARGLAGQGADGATEAALERVAASHYELMGWGKGQKFFDAKELLEKPVLAPRDYIPQAPDLPGAGKDVKTTKIPGSKVAGATYWSYVCVLIALVKAEGTAAVETVTQKPESDPDKAVQNLHNHFMRQNIEYDDSSTRFRVMQTFGYKLIFAGNIPWADLPKHVELPSGKYIFDIKDHTVMVEVPNDIDRGTDPLPNVKAALKPQSDKNNYSKDETLSPVNYIWSK